MSAHLGHTGIEPGEVTAFLTDSTLCIGCKACEVACKEWNGIEADGLGFTAFSYDNTTSLGHSTWRHVKFVEDQVTPGIGGNDAQQISWAFSSDVCKHCEVAGCLEACPTGSLIRTEFGGVYLQPDICNGCAYCVVSCPFGVVQKSHDDGRAFKCTFCVDRQKAQLEPACAKACPTDSIKFGRRDDILRETQERMEVLHERGMTDARVYDPTETSVKGIHAVFILRGAPETYNLPPHPVVPTQYLKAGWTSAAIEGVAMVAAVAASFFALRKSKRNGQ